VDTYYTGTQSAYIKIQNVELEEGRFFDEREENGANVIVLGHGVKEELFADQDPLNQVVKINSVPFVVIGYTKEAGSSAFTNLDDQVWIPLVIAQRQLLGINHLQSIIAKVDSPENVKPAIADIRRLLMDRHKIKNEEDVDFSVRDIADAVKLLENITNALRLFLTAMAAIALVVGGIGIMNIMLVTVAERTREIGLRKALGARRTVIRNQFLFEAGTVTLTGGIIGIVIGILVAYLIALGARYAGYDWAFVISPLAIFLAVGVSILTGVVFGLYPAFKAAKLDPIEALRYE
jgi:putative ABC transport system permease protein